jgi:hypothetical protein
MYMVIKLHLLLSVLLFPALALATTIGVIRWDCICDPTSPELKSLSPLKWHYRVPDFLTIAADNSVTGTENDQAVIDQQITYAKNAGIDYWAFITQPTTNPDADEFYALDKYLSSSRKADVKFCIILHKYNSDWAGRVTQLVNWFKEASYVKVLGNRPLVYFYSLTDMETQYGDQTQNCIDQLRSQTTAAGLGSPYLVPMNGSGYGTDARSAYCFWNAGGDGTYAPHAAANAATWDSWITWGGSQVDWLRIIPLVSAGINDGPRVDNPPPWGGGNSPKVDYPTPYQLAMHIKRGLDYVASHPGQRQHHRYRHQPV